MRYARVFLNGLVDCIIDSGADTYTLSDEEAKHFNLIEIGDQDVTECAYKNNEWVHVGSPPFPYYSFDSDTLQWYDSRTLEEITTEFQRELRRIRQRLLLQSDWTQFPDSPLTEEQKVKWQVYRQSLRDMPQTYANETNIENVVFPSKP